MEKRLSLKDFMIRGCKAEEMCDGSTIVVEYDKKDECIELDGAPGSLGGVDWSGIKYFAADMINYEDSTMSVTLNFWDEANTTEKPDVTVITGLIPGLKTKVTFSFEDFNAQNVHLKRTPGRLTTLLWGKKLDVRRINRFSIGSAMGSAAEWHPVRRLELSGLCLTDEEIEDYPIDNIKLVDELGQQAQKDWPGKTHGVDELVNYLNEELRKPDDISFFDGWNRYGGWTGKRFEATGYFRSQYDGRRWWVVDPDGCVFFSVGVNHVQPGVECKVTRMEKLFTWLPDREGKFKECWRVGDQLGRGGPDYNISTYSFVISNLIRAYGDKWWEGWSKTTGRRLVEWGFNTIANWTPAKFIQGAKLPYVWPLKDFPETKKCIFRDFPDVFSPEYQENSDKFAEQLKAFEGDPYLIGYFLRNEPMWALIGGEYIVTEMLDSDTSFYSRDAFIQFVSDRYSGDINKFNKAWNIAIASFDQLNHKVQGLSSVSDIAREDIADFSRILIERYVRIPSEAVKQVDPNHMNMGMRYSFVSEESLQNAIIGCENFDVFSMNSYNYSAAEELDKIGKITNMPVIIGEFHFGALDRGVWDAGLKGVPTQEERGRAYTYYLENAAANKYCVGAHYFMFNDQPLIGRSDGENFQIGCVDVCNRPYKEFIDGVVTANRRIYEVADGKLAAYNKMPNTAMKL